MKITDRDITKEELQSIYDDFTRIELRDGISQCGETRRQLVAEENGQIIGFASGLTNHKWFYLSDMWVEENHRRQGLGAELLTRLEAIIKAGGTEHVYTWTSGMINPRFYEKLGYKAFTVFENYYEIEGYNRIGYRKDL